MSDGEYVWPIGHVRDVEISDREEFVERLEVNNFRAGATAFRDWLIARGHAIEAEGRGDELREFLREHARAAIAKRVRK